MPSYLIKIDDDAYIEWSTVVDAPYTKAMSREDMIEHLVHLEVMMIRIAAVERICRADNADSSLLDDRHSGDPLRHLRWNRAGPGEACVVAEDLVRYLKGEIPLEACELREVEDVPGP